MFISKKIVASLLGVSLLVMPAVVGGQTVEELQAQITALMAQITALNTQIAAMGGSSMSSGSPAACAGITFAVNLAQGSTGSDVKCLQALLNQSAGTQVAATGVGSAGQETTYFGSLTRAAVIKFQEMYASEVLTPLGLTSGTGYVGSATRVKLNSMLTTAPPVTPPGTPPTGGTPGQEGTLTVTADASPANAQTIYAGSTNVAVAGLKVKALGSDIRLNRLDINFTTRPWLNVSTITVSDGATDVAVYPVTESNTIEITAGSSYTVRITNLNLVVPDGVTKVLTIKVDPKLVAGDSSETITYQVGVNAVRGVDGASIQQYAPSTALTARTFTVSTQTGALQLTVNTNNPAQRNVQGSASVITENVELLTFDLKATVADVIVSAASTTLTDPSSAVQTLKLYDGSTLLASVAATAGALNQFSPLNLTIPKDTTKTLSIKADVAALDGSPVEGASSSVSVATTNVVAQNAATFASITTTGSTAAGKTAWFWTSMPTLAVKSKSIATNRAGRTDGSNTISADASITFSVTAVGGDIYVGSTTGNAIVATTSASESGISITPMTNSFVSTAEIDTGQGSAWKVPSGTTKDFTVTSFFTNASPTATFVYMYLKSLSWGTSTTGTVDHTINWADLQVGVKTDSVYLQAKN